MGTFSRQGILLLRPLCGPLRAPPRTSAGANLSGLELHEDDVFWIGLGPSSFDLVGHGSPGPMPPDAMGSGPGPRPRIKLYLLLSSGIIAALSEDPPSALASLMASARTTPATFKIQMYSLSVPVGEIDQQSAPVNVPAVPPEVKKGWEEDGDEYEMLPPHEIVARASRNGSPMIPFSVLKGAGRTLKGRDLRRVRNAVLQKTGFLD